MTRKPQKTITFTIIQHREHEMKTTWTQESNDADVTYTITVPIITI